MPPGSSSLFIVSLSTVHSEPGLYGPTPRTFGSSPKEILPEVNSSHLVYPMTLDIVPKAVQSHKTGAKLLFCFHLHIPHLSSMLTMN